MRGSLFCHAVVVISTLGVPAAEAQDEDFAGANVTLDADATWRGVKTSIGTLTVSAGSTLRADGELDVHADSIVVDGSLVADGAGSPGVAGSSAAGLPGNGMGAGGAGGATLRGGGGGGFGGVGGCGGRFAGGGACGGAGGATYGSLSDVRYLGSSGGSGGGIAAESPGGSSGGGGGVIALFARTLTIRGAVTSNGGGGAVRGSAGLVSGGGGGSGGAIILSADTFDVTGVISVAGGPGGSVSCGFGSNCSGGGGGGGGRVMLLYSDALPTFDAIVTGGARGAGPPTAASAGAAGTTFRDHVPVVALDPIAGGAPGLLDIGYGLRDAESDTCTLEVAVVDAAGGVVVSTEGVGMGDGTGELTSSATGVHHTYVWNAAADVPAGGPVQIRVRARDPYGWGPPAFAAVELAAVAVDGGLSAPDASTPGDDGGAIGSDGGIAPGTDAGVSTRGRDGGCSCEMAGPRRSGPGVAAALVVLGLLVRRRRRGIT